MPNVQICGVTLHRLTMDEAVAAGLALLETPGVHLCCTPNPKLLTMAAQDTALRKILNGASISLADGVGITLTSRLTGQGTLPRIPGADYALALAQAAGQRQKRLFLFGGQPGVAADAGAALCRRCPGLVLAGTLDGYSAAPEQAAERIRASGAELVYVCLGCPAQEYWMARCGAATGARLLAGLGGTLDVWAGRTRRAPAGWQRLGLEWLWRGLLEPKRIPEWRRLPLFLCQALTWPREEEFHGR